MLTTINDPPPELEEQSARNTPVFFSSPYYGNVKGESQILN